MSVPVPEPETGTEYRFDLAPEPESARCARLAVRGILRDGPLAALIDDACLVADELVANAARFSDVVALTVTVGESAVFIEVTDASGETPAIKESYGDAESEGGRGLLIVQAIAGEWGVSTGDRGKTVWAKVSTTAV